MAPNLNVKSESWLDLSATYYDRHCKETNKLLRSHKIQLQESVNWKQKELDKYLIYSSQYQNHRHSISNFYVAAPLSGNQSAANFQDPSGGATPPAAKNQQHLLIRLRQQSYLNKSSNSLLSSNLSNSIELNPSLAGRGEGVQSESNCELYLRRMFVAIQDNQHQQQQQQQRPGLLKRESQRLRLLRGKLQNRRPGRRRAGSQQYLCATGCQEPLELDPSASPFVRSISSFSQRLSGKLSDLRHSWKHFLHNYNNQREPGMTGGEQLARAESHQEIDPHRQATSNKPALGHTGSANQLSELEVNKRQLTDEWVLRHRQYLAAGRSLEVAPDGERPRSLQISDGSPKVANRRSKQIKESRSELSSATRRSAEKQTDTPTTRPFSQLDTDNDLVRANSHLLQVPARPRGRNSPQTSASANSSTTLVSSIGADNFRTVVTQTSSDEKGSNSTLNSRHEEEDMRKRSSESPKVRKSMEGPLLKQQQQQLVATSDYWSTVNSQQQLLPAAQMLLAESDQAYYCLEAEVASAHELDKQQVQLGLQQLNLASHNGDPQQQNLLAGNFARVNNMILPDPALAMSAYQQQLLAQQLDEDYDDYAIPADDTCCRLDRNQVELVRMIGEGQKGYVFLGKLQSKDGTSIMDVAIKTLKYETEQLIDKLMREASMMRQLEHPHIIRFIGVCPETPALIAMELAEFGEIKQYLKLNKHLILNSQLILFTFQISTALSYLESKQYVHRDVAARNILVCSHSCVKLADFGLSRNLQLSGNVNQRASLNQDNSCFGTDSNNYVAAAKGKLPVRWLAPESLTFRRFTSASDVWMFAVCAWELFQLGQQRPWSQIRNNQVLLAIESGQRLERPANCPLRLYQLMLQCWSYAPIQRPKFRELKQSIWSVYLNERAKEQMELEKQQRLLAASRLQQLQQDRLMLLMNKHQNQNQNQNILLVQPSAVQQQQQQHKHQQHQQQRLASTGNVSGYSSTSGLTAEHSNNSSRSSSMGSLARQQAKLWQEQRKHHQQQVAASGARAAAAELASRQESQRKAALESNMRRFQRPPGQLLQKQRSQGSIVMDQLRQQQPAVNRTTGSHQYGYDDNEILKRQRKFQMSAGYRVEEEEEDDDDDDYDSSASDPNDVVTVNYTNRLWLSPSSNQLTKEPTYEGLHGAGGEIAMVKRPSNAKRNQQSRPVSLQMSAPSTPLAHSRNRLEQSAELGQDEKLAEAIRSLKSSPMKARLTYNNNLELQQQRMKQAQEEEEAARQLAIHQRLLGHIRPQSAASSKRRSSQLIASSSPTNSSSSNQTGKEKPETSVDQSLMLLESLIGENKSTGSRTSKQTSSPGGKPYRGLSIFGGKR